MNKLCFFFNSYIKTVYNISDSHSKRKIRQCSTRLCKSVGALGQLAQGRVDTTRQSGESSPNLLYISQCANRYLLPCRINLLSFNMIYIRLHKPNCVCVFVQYRLAEQTLSFN